MLTILLISFGFLFLLAGLVGCVLPIIPGPPLCFFSLIILSYAKDWEPFSATFLVIMAILTLFVTILDYVVPVSGAKKFGASKSGVWGSIIGMFLGVFFFPPWGMILGAFVGAFIGELLADKTGSMALRASWGVFAGVIIGLGLKLAFCGVLTFFFIRGLF